VQCIPAGPVRVRWLSIEAAGTACELEEIPGEQGSIFPALTLMHGVVAKELEPFFCMRQRKLRERQQVLMKDRADCGINHSGKVGLEFG